MHSGNGGDSVPASQIGQASVDALVANQAEVADACARLCRFLPPGSSYMFAIDFQNGPRLVTKDNLPIGESCEVIQIVRPLSFIQQKFQVKAKTVS